MAPRLFVPHNPLATAAQAQQQRPEHQHVLTVVSDLEPALDQLLTNAWQGRDVRSYDIIGDIHGNGPGNGHLLDGLLASLGWTIGSSGHHQHPEPERQVVFVGDLIDRGDHQRHVLHTVRRMVDAGTALIVMGNHEFNAICFATPDPRNPGEYLRKHSEKNERQHWQFLRQLDPDERASWIEWFRTLPIWLDLGAPDLRQLRVVHACWHERSIQFLKAEFGGNQFPAGDEPFVVASTKETPVWTAVEVVLKGPEIKLSPYGLPDFLDQGGTRRSAARSRWWNGSAATIADLIDLPSDPRQHDGSPYPVIPPTPCAADDLSYAYDGTIPVFYGHHWRKWEPTKHLDYTDRTACVDFSAGKSGPLVAYQWRGEAIINPTHFVACPGPEPTAIR